ncbi:MAG: trimethylamine methyltransferase family protein [Desulfobacterales bacterium]|nr:trimethylamine methyltransferase family protein [Desulfobacterales bacterium]
MKRHPKVGKRSGSGLAFQVLSNDAMHDIHAASLEILGKTGIFVEDEEALDLFASGGAAVDSLTKTVKIPPSMVEDAVQSAPEIVTLAGRTPENDLLLEPDRVYFDCFGEGIQLFDRHTRELRKPLKADLAESTRLIDALEHIDICHRSLGSHDVTPELGALHNAETILSNTTKHTFLAAGSGWILDKIIKMMALIVGGEDKISERPILTSGSCAVSPLRLPRDCCEVVMMSARRGLVSKVLTQCMAGGSSPVTMAGTLALHNSEVLSGCILSQLAKKGSPFIYASSTCSMDLRFGAAVVGNPETALMNSAIAEMAKYYLLPVQVAGG